MADILVIEDEEIMRVTLERALRLQGYRVAAVSGGVEGLEELLTSKPDVVLLDLMLRDAHFNGMELLARVRQLYPELPVVMMSGYGTVDRAVQAMRLGADEFIRKPFNVDEVCAVLDRVANRVALRQSVRLNQAEKLTPETEREFISEDPTLLSMLDRVRSIGRDRWSNTLIMGEAGSGKTALARMIHNQDGPHDRPLIIVDCIRLQTKKDLEAVFGGRSVQEISRCELAEGGSLLFEEIGSLSVEGQGHLLHLIDHRNNGRYGQAQSPAVRLIATSRVMLAPLSDGGQIADHLLQRLGTNSLYIPPLRKRRGDIELLCRFFWNAFGGLDLPLSLKEVRDRLPVDYSWPGNVRELKNWTERRWISEQAAIGDTAIEQDSPLALYAHEVVAQAEPGRLFDQALKFLLDATIRECGGDLEVVRQHLGLDDSELRAYLERSGLAKPAEDL